jgi:hypothetical protein
LKSHKLYTWWPLNTCQSGLTVVLIIQLNDRWTTIGVDKAVVWFSRQAENIQIKAKRQSFSYHSFCYSFAL